LQDLSNRKFVVTEPVQDNRGKTCCERKECVHQFYIHSTLSSPWWVCLWKTCKIHFQMKQKNKIWPKSPKVTIQNAQKCPCLRIGCMYLYADIITIHHLSQKKHVYRKTANSTTNRKGFRVATSESTPTRRNSRYVSEPIIRRIGKDDGIAPAG
jgi:hypothetical protein